MNLKTITKHLTKRLIILSLVLSLVGTGILTMVIYENTTFLTKIIIFILLLVLTLSQGVLWGHAKMKMKPKLSLMSVLN